MNYISSYTEPRPYYPLPIFATHLDISHSAMVLYARLFARCMLSRKNGIFDEEGYAYCFYSHEDMARDMKCSPRTIQNLLRELDKNDLIERHRTAGKANRIYVKQTYFAYGEQITDDDREALIIEATEREEVKRAKARWEMLHPKEKALPM